MSAAEQSDPDRRVQDRIYGLGEDEISYQDIQCLPKTA